MILEEIIGIIVVSLLYIGFLMHIKKNNVFKGEDAKEKKFLKQFRKLYLLVICSICVIIIFKLVLYFKAIL